jgi:hypothetical protein
MRDGIELAMKFLKKSWNKKCVSKLEEKQLQWFGHGKILDRTRILRRALELQF